MPSVHPFEWEGDREQVAVTPQVRAQAMDQIERCETCNPEAEFPFDWNATEENDA